MEDTAGQPAIEDAPEAKKPAAKSQKNKAAKPNKKSTSSAKAKKAPAKAKKSTVKAKKPSAKSSSKRSGCVKGATKKPATRGSAKDSAKGASKKGKVGKGKNKEKAKAVKTEKKGLSAKGFTKDNIPTSSPEQTKKRGNFCNMTQFLCGLLAFDFKKCSNPQQAAYMRSFFDAVENNPAVQAELKSMGLFNIRLNEESHETRTFLVGKKEIHELQLICIVGTDASTTAIHNLWKKVVSMANRYTNTVSDNNKYATQTHMGEHWTLRTGPSALEVRFPDENIIPIICAAYGEESLEEVATVPNIISQFFADHNRGHRFISTQVTGSPSTYDDATSEEEAESDDDMESESESEEEEEHEEEEWDQENENEEEDDQEEQESDSDND